MKKYVSICSLILSVLFLFSCSVTHRQTSTTTQNEYGGIIECPVHSMDYHSFDDVFIQYVGSDAFNEWLDEQTESGSQDDCLFGFGFPDFIEDFDITEETYYSLFEDTMSSYMYDHPAELLFDGTHEEVEAYYRDIEACSIRLEQKQCIMELKQALAEKADAIIPNIRTISIGELRSVSGLTESEFQTVVQNINSTKSYINISADNIDSVVSEKDMLFVNISEITISPEVSNINILPDVEEVVEPDVEAVIEPDVEVVIP